MLVRLQWTSLQPGPGPEGHLYLIVVLQLQMRPKRLQVGYLLWTQNFKI